MKAPITPLLFMNEAVTTASCVDTHVHLHTLWDKINRFEQDEILASIYMFVSLYKLIRIGTKSLKIYSRFVHCLVLGLTSHERQHLVPQTLGLQKKIKSVRDQRWWGDCIILKKHKHKRNNNSLFSRTSPCTVEKNVAIYFVDIYFTDSAQIQSVGHNRDLNTSERTALKDLQSVAPGPLRCIWLGE